MNDAGPGWLDMDGYPELDLDPADPVLGQVRDILRGHEVAPLPDGAWEAALHAAIGESEPGDVSWSADPDTGAGGLWWTDQVPDIGVDHYPRPGRDEPTDPHWPTDPHFDGGHW